MASEIKVDTVSEKTSGSGVTIDGLLIKDGGISGDVSLIGTTPTFTIGDAGAEDAALVFDGNAQDFYIALDDSADDLVIGKGSAVGTTPAVSIDENLQVIVHDNLSLLSDSSVLKFGTDGDTTLTHTDGTGLTLNSTNKICFNDATQYIQGASGTVLDIAATDEIELTATEVEINVTTLDVNGATDLSGALTIGGVTSFPDGSAGAPSITNTGDTNTGIYFSAADAISFSTGGTERMHIEDDGKVSIGETGAALGTLHVKTSNNAASSHADADELVLENDGNCGMSILSDNNDYGTIHFGDQDNNDIGMIRYNHGNNTMDFTVNAAERMRIRDDGNINLPLDDVGFSFGASQDLWFGGYAGEEGLQINRGDSQVANPLGSGGGGGAAFIFYNPGTSAAAEIQTVAGEGKSASINLKQDQHDDASDQWWMGQQSTDFAANDGIFWTDYDASSADNEMRLTQAGVLTAEGAMNASTTIDYAEYFEWKTELANDDKITETYGLSVVLDNGKVRLAEAGEEAKVLGVVRPNNTSAMVGGAHSFKYKGKYEKNVWGEPVRENWTQVTWNETRTKYWKDGDNLPEGKSVGDVRGTYVHGHVYPKDRIPSKVLKPEWELDRSEPNWRTLASNLTSEDLVVPSTDSEKSAANYTERSTYKRDKGDGHKKGDKLTRKKVNASYDPSLTYTPREKRRKEWCIVGLIGQVQVRDTAIIPTHWTKLKNLETGIDMYYVFNK